MGKYVDLTGQIFGDWTAVERISSRNTKYICVCKCSTIKEVIGNNLTRGLSKGCGCVGLKKQKRFSKKIGSKVGRLTILKTFQKVFGGRKYTQYECICDCGKLVNTALIAVKSCGCLQKEKLVERSRKQMGFASTTAVLSYYKRNAKNRNLEWNLSREEFSKIVQGSCYYCNSSPNNVFAMKSGDKLIRNGIDRLDNTKGYTLTNCVSCCKICNRAKGSLPLDEFLKWINNIHRKAV